MAVESLASRSTQITQLVLEKGNHELAYRHLVSREGLLDALFALYDECCHDYMRKNKNISKFVDKFQHAITDLRKLQVNIGDFEVKRIIGRGHFGEVHMVREKQSGNMYAMKILKKNLTLEQEAVAFYEEERDIMMKAKSPWITQLQYSFQDARNLYLVMEFHPGGDMLALLERHDNVLPEEVAVFYAAELVLAVHSVHSMGYVHRDIKPDNILIDLTGHLKLADFGSAAKLNEDRMVTSKMPVGTPDYIAPEVLTAMNSNRPSSYSEKCDWWSVGIVTYEMLFGATPFGDDKVLVTYANIMNYKKTLTFPDDIEYSDAAKSMIDGCLTDWKTRLGYKELYNHQFFKAVDWANILKISPPYVPTISGEDDAKYFDTFEQESHKPSLDPYKPVKDFTGKNLPFVGFTYSLCLSNEMENSTRRMSMSYESYHTLPKSRKKSAENGKSSDVELKKLVVNLESMQSALKSEVSLLKGKLERTSERKTEVESENERLREKNIKQCSEISALKSLLEMEKKHRVSSEERAIELLKAIEQKYKKREKILTDGFKNNLMLSPANKFISPKKAFIIPSSPAIKSVRFREPVVESEKSFEPYTSSTSSNETNNGSVTSNGSDSDPNHTLNDVDVSRDISNDRSELYGDDQDTTDSVFSITLEDGSVLMEESSTDTELLKSKHDCEYLQAEVEKLHKELELTKAELSEYKVIEEGALGDGKHYKDEKKNKLTYLTSELRVLQEKYDQDCQIFKEKLRNTEDTCTKLNALIDNTRRELEETIEENKSLEIEKEEFRQSTEVLKEVVTRLENNLKDVENKLRRNSMSAAAMLSDSFDTNDTSSELKSKLVLKESELDDVKSKVRKLENQVTILQSEVQIAAAETETTRLKYKTVKKDAMATIKDLESNLNSVKYEKDALLSKIDQIEMKFNSSLREKELKIVDAAATYESALERVKDLETQIGLLKLKEQETNSKVVDGYSVVSERQLNVKESGEVQKSPGSAEIVSKVSNMETVLNRIHETQVSETSQIRQLRDTLRQKESELSDAKLDLRISQREKKEADESLERSRFANQTLREKLSNLEKEHSKCGELESNLNDQIAQLQQNLNNKVEELQRSANRFDDEKERLEERIKLLKEEFNSKKHLEEKCARNEGQYQELDRQNMKVKERCDTLEDERQKLLTENEALKLDLGEKKKRCDYLEKNTTVLKNVCCTIEEQIKDLELIIEGHEENISTLEREKNSLNNEIERLKHDLESVKKTLESERSLRDEAEMQLSDAEGDYNNQMDKIEVKVATLERKIEDQAERISQLTEQRTIMEREVEVKVSAYCSLKNKMDNLEDENLNIKEEAAKHITSITQLKKKNIDLQEALEQNIKRCEEADWHIDRLMNEKERESATYEQEISKRDSQIQQLTKVTDLLQSRISEMEKKKKHWLFGSSKGKENKGPIMPPAENKRDRENRMYKEMKEAAEKMTMKPPDSPASMRSDATTDSTSSNESERLSRGTSATGSMRIKHNIPHVLYDAHSTWNTVCHICTTSIRFSKPCMKCRSCDMILHRTCKDKVENTCGLPKQLAESLRAVKERIRQGIYTSFNLDDMDGWVKIPRNRNAGWEDRFMKLVDTTLCILDREPEPNTSAVALTSALYKFELAPTDGIVTFKENPSASEVLGASDTHIPLLLKLTLWPNNKAIPNKDFIVLLSTDEDKFHWSAAIERIVTRHLHNKGKIVDPVRLEGSKVLTIENSKIEPLCCCHMSKNVLLIGTTEGLFAFDLNKSFDETLKPILPKIGVVHTMTKIDRVAIFLIVAGEDRTLYTLTYTDILSKLEFGHTPVNALPVSNVKQCQRVVASFTAGINPPIIAIATSSYVGLLKWNAANRSFIMKQEMRISQPCSYIQITAHVVLYSTDKLYVIDLKEPGTCVEEFMDQASDNMLAMFINDVLKRQQSCVNISLVSPPEREEQYLLCLKDLGIIINYLGQQDNSNQLNWTKQPFEFAYQSSTLFIIYKNIVEVLEVTPDQSSLRGRWAYLNIQYPKYLGSSPNGEVYISNSRPDVVEIYRVAGPAVLEECSKAEALENGIANPKTLTKSDSNHSGGSDFSFTSSLEEALDTSDIMSAVLETSRNTE